MKQLLTPSSTRSVQGTRVQQELEVLRHKHLAQSQRNKLKDRTYTFYMHIYNTPLYSHKFTSLIHIFRYDSRLHQFPNTQFARHR